MSAWLGERLKTMDEKFNAICIRSVPWRDNDKLDCVIRGAQSPKSKWRFAQELFCFAEYVTTERFGKKTVKEANQIDGFYGLRKDVDKLYAASAVLEFLRFNVYEGESGYDLFLLSLNSLRAIEKGSYPFAGLVKFLIGATGCLGYDVELSRCGRCGEEITGRTFFDFDAGHPVCESCSDAVAVEMRHETYLYLKTLAESKAEDLEGSEIFAANPLLTDRKIEHYAIKFAAYYIQLKLGCALKTVSQIMENYIE